jgi:hypothetical protein
MRRARQTGVLDMIILLVSMFIAVRNLSPRRGSLLMSAHRTFRAGPIERNGVYRLGSTRLGRTMMFEALASPGKRYDCGDPPALLEPPNGARAYAIVARGRPVRTSAYRAPVGGLIVDVGCSFLSFTVLLLAVLSGCGKSAIARDGGRREDTEQPLIPDANGRVNRATTGATGIQGRWFALVDRLDCQSKGGHHSSECSMLVTPDPTAAGFPPTADLGMCTVGIAAKAIADVDGKPDWTNIYGAMIGLTLDDGRPYDGPAHGVTGFAFHIDSELPPNAGIQVQMSTVGSSLTPALWGGGAAAERSPVHAGRNEFRWADVASPMYVVNPPRFDPTRLLSIAFYVPSDAAGPKSFSFCIDHLAALTN